MKCLYYTEPYPRASAKWETLNSVKPYKAVCAKTMGDVKCSCNVPDYQPRFQRVTRGALNLRDGQDNTINIATGLRAGTIEDDQRPAEEKSATGKLGYWIRCSTDLHERQRKYGLVHNFRVLGRPFFPENISQDPCSPATEANRVQSPARSLPDFCKWESCRTMPLGYGFLGTLPFPPPLHSGAAPNSHHFTLSPALKPLMLRAAQISSSLFVEGNYICPVSPEIGTRSAVRRDPLHNLHLGCNVILLISVVVKPKVLTWAGWWGEVERNRFPMAKGGVRAKGVCAGGGRCKVLRRPAIHFLRGTMIDACSVITFRRQFAPGVLSRCVEESPMFMTAGSMGAVYREVYLLFASFRRPKDSGSVRDFWLHLNSNFICEGAADSQAALTRATTQAFRGPTVRVLFPLCVSSRSEQVFLRRHLSCTRTTTWSIASRHIPAHTPDAQQIRFFHSPLFCTHPTRDVRSDVMFVRNSIVRALWGVEVMAIHSTLCHDATNKGVKLAYIGRTEIDAHAVVCKVVQSLRVFERRVPPLSFTRPFIVLQRKWSRGARSGDRGGHATNLTAPKPCFSAHGSPLGR
ncbi:hypothetical protein PR048_027556 [Dryococelus australis]|uniref:Uncharacterized protein n=1 Tax=Dryococelus australis TaxID=614101 RepID=A0ABQ9GGV5_9NEOP|nr:hypothetical protein PR048_027556 [Dryococelus australis]